MSQDNSFANSEEIEYNNTQHGKVVETIYRENLKPLNDPNCVHTLVEDPTDETEDYKAYKCTKCPLGTLISKHS